MQTKVILIDYECIFKKNVLLQSRVASLSEEIKKLENDNAQLSKILENVKDRLYRFEKADEDARKAREYAYYMSGPTR